MTTKQLHEMTFLEVGLMMHELLQRMSFVGDDGIHMSQIETKLILGMLKEAGYVEDADPKKSN